MLLNYSTNFTFYNFDIIDETIIYFFNDNNNLNIKEIYHLASLASPDKYQEFPLETMKVNLDGTHNMLKIAIHKDAKFLFTSTSEVYGDPLVHPQPESYYGNVNTVGPRSCYDESKRCGETYVNIFREKYKNNNLKIVRIFNTYGPYMDINDGRVITNFIKAILNDFPLNIYGSGKQTRSFCYISDMVDGLVRMMESNESGPINLGSPDNEFTLLELVETFEKILNKKLNINFMLATKDDPQVRKPIISLARDKLGFDPLVTLENGLTETYNYFKNIL